MEIEDDDEVLVAPTVKQEDRLCLDIRNQSVHQEDKVPTLPAVKKELKTWSLETLEESARRSLAQSPVETGRYVKRTFASAFMTSTPVSYHDDDDDGDEDALPTLESTPSKRRGDGSSTRSSAKPEFKKPRGWPT